MKRPRLPRPALPDRTAAHVIAVMGLGCLDGAAWWLYPIAGLAVAGAMLLLTGWVMDR